MKEALLGEDEDILPSERELEEAAKRTDICKMILTGKIQNVVDDLEKVSMSYGVLAVFRVLILYADISWVFTRDASFALSSPTALVD